MLPSAPGAASHTSQDAGTVRIHVVEGSLQTCEIWRQGHLSLQGQEALRRVQQVGELFWTVRLQKPTSSLVLGIHHGSAPPPDAQPLRQAWDAVPRRLVEPGSVIATWDRAVRIVFCLVDGKTSIAKLRELLPYSPEQIERVLKTLSEKRLITFT
ncbi:MAG: hypothetical protein ABI456_14525 [Ktedonobacteraceae bacterium]